MGPFDDNEIYPNQPLSDVSCEVRFHGEMQVECERHRFWNEIRDKYSDILVPNLEQGQAVALQHYKFRDPARQRTVAVALNSLAFSETKYSGHKEFIGEFGRLIDVFSTVFPKLGKISRIGWRYINVMPFSREDGLVPLNRILKLDVTLPDNMFSRTAALDLQWTGKCMDGDVVIRLAAVFRKGTSEQEALLLDIDYGRVQPNISWDGARALIEEARGNCRSVFENLITDNYRNYLRGVSL